MPGDLFLEKLKAYDGIPEVLLEEKELHEFFEPILRADFKAIGAYRYTPAPPLDLPITVIVGSEDKPTFEEACRWQEVTRRKVTVERLPGKHFFIFEQAPVVARIIREKLGAPCRLRPDLAPALNASP